MAVSLTTIWNRFKHGVLHVHLIPKRHVNGTVPLVRPLTATDRKRINTTATSTRQVPGECERARTEQIAVGRLGRAISPKRRHSIFDLTLTKRPRTIT